MSELAAFLGVPVGGTLPAITFFLPRPKFSRYMVTKYRRQPIYDVGAGVGHVSRALADSGLNVTALDLYRRDDEKFPITLADATTYQYQPGSIIMFCRPSHSGFVEKAIGAALSRGVQDILYVGLPRNLSDDLGDYRRSFRRVLRDIGMDGENLYTMSKATA